jgi:hypothetical protein
MPTHHHVTNRSTPLEHQTRSWIIAGHAQICRKECTESFATAKSDQLVPMQLPGGQHLSVETHQSVPVADHGTSRSPSAGGNITRSGSSSIRSRHISDGYLEIRNQPEYSAHEEFTLTNDAQLSQRRDIGDRTGRDAQQSGTEKSQSKASDLSGDDLASNVRSHSYGLSSDEYSHQKTRCCGQRAPPG